MTVRLSVDPTVNPARGCAGLVVTLPDGTLDRLSIDFASIGRQAQTASATALDLLVFAAAVYAADRGVRRFEAADRWTRTIPLVVPVRDPGLWNPLADNLAECLSFLTGDRWTLAFEKRTHAVIALPNSKRRRRGAKRLATGETVCLFSGGLDSLVGALDWLEDQRGRLALVGHHDPRVAGPMSDQNGVLAVLRPAYPGRLDPFLVGVGPQCGGPEITFRSRSFLFLALGMFVANFLGKRTPVLIPENGTIALNLPLTPSRRGSCSTRTAHPHYLDLVQRAVGRLGLEHAITNPLAGKTKGEVLTECRNSQVLRAAVSATVSCAKRGHTSTWHNRSASGCGRCMPCIYRRAALHRLGEDIELCGVDVTRGGVDLTDQGGESADDFRACLSLLRRRLDQRAVEKMLVASGPLRMTDVRDYAAVVCRAMDEVRAWLRAKATADIRHRAGITEETC